MDNSKRIKPALKWAGIIILFIGFWVLAICNRFVPAKNPTPSQILNYVPSARRTVIIRELESVLDCDETDAAELYDYLDKLYLGKIAGVTTAEPEGRGERAIRITTEDTVYVVDLSVQMKVMGVVDVTENRKENIRILSDKKVFRQKPEDLSVILFLLVSIIGSEQMIS